MNKKIQKHGPLYDHAKQELERAGVSPGKGNYDQKVFHTTLKLVDIYERAAESELLGETIHNLFSTLSKGELINPPTDDPDEWKLMPGLGEGVMVLRRCNLFRSNDGGVTWYRADNGASGVSKVVTKEADDGSEERSEEVQPTESK